MTSTEHPPDPGFPRELRPIVVTGLVLGTIMLGVTSTIVNVSLPQMQAELGATPDQIGWVLTSFLVASVVTMPLTGFLADSLGRRRLLLGSYAGFIATSMLCGFSQTLAELVAFRILQGIFGGSIIPLTQSTIAHIYPPEERGRGMAIWGIGTTAAPLIGPLLGGWLTDVASWHWSFFINAPVGALGFLVCWRFLPDSPKRPRRLDWSGLLLLALAVGGFQYVLDRGNGEDWFDSTQIRVAALLSGCGFIGFALHSWRGAEQPILRLEVFRDRNFSAATSIITVASFGMFGLMFLHPQMAESVLRFPALETGYTMAPRGIALTVAMLMMGRYLGRIDTRLILAFGLSCASFGSYMASLGTLDTDLFWLAWVAMVQGFGMGFVWIPLATLGLWTIPARLAPEAAGLYSLVRTFGQSAGVAIIGTEYARGIQAAWAQLIGYVNAYSPAVTDYLSRLDRTDLDPLALELLSRELQQQAQLISISHAYQIIALSFLMTIPLLLLIGHSGAMRRPAAAAASAPPGT